MPFQPVPTKVDFVAQEKQILQFWKETRAFYTMRELHKGQPRWSFIDGPITANNPMGVHHAWGRTYKDVFGRYKTMRGHELRYQNGFDCQGLWVEVNVEKELGFQSKKDIENYGLAPFVILCKQRVLNYAAVQTEQSIRLGMWMDWDDPNLLRYLRDKLGEDPNQHITITTPSGAHLSGTVEYVISQLGLPQYGGSYFTFSDKNNYDIWSFLRKCHDNGWLYKGTDVMPWCWRCGTGISQHEIVTEGYIEKADPSVTLRFPLVDRPGESLLVWTTTPWTLTSNVAAAVGPDLTYVKVRQGNEVLYLSKGTTKMLKGSFEVLGELKGAEMQGWKYRGPFDDLPAAQLPGGWAEPTMRRLFAHIKETAIDAHRIILWDEVGEAEGTGIVHIAPGCGEEDFALGKQYNLPVLAPLDENGVYGDGFGWLAGKNVADVTDPIIEELKKKGLLYKFELYTHRYPECWRCHTPLVFRLVDEWFIAMDGIRPLMMDITNQIKWIPEFGRERELDWLRNMHDWMISKKRYWGLALPIWECEQCGHFTVIGSREELQARAVEGWEKFDGHTPHRPYIDEVKIKCEKCGALVSRIKDVGNPWLDAGIVSFSTMGYRTQHDYWLKWFPGDLISESFPGQFRNWFYSLLTMAAVLENKPATRVVHGYGTLLAEDGRQMHKSLGNAIEFNEAADTIGADVMRWMYCCQRYDTDMLFGYHVADETRRRFFLPLWNVYNFFVTYANLDKWTPTTVGNQRSAVSDLDRWILARLQQLIAEVTAPMDEYIIYKAVYAIEAFVDDLSNWYVRRSRRRFWKSEADADKNAAYATLYEVLVTLTKLLAPFIPFLAEAMYQNLVRSVDANAPESVHHCDFPRADASLLDTNILAEMDAARKVVNLGHSVRAENNLKVRQPLARVLVVAPYEQRARLAQMSTLIADELNVKTLQLVENEAQLVTYKLLPDNRVLGPKFGKMFPQVRAALGATDPYAAVATLRAGKNLALDVDGQRVELAPSEVLITPQPKSGFAVKADGEYVVALDTNVTPELKAEGLAREFVRRVQDLRKSAEFDIADHIRLYYTATPTLANAIEAHRAYIMGETLADEMHASAAPANAAIVEDTFDGESVTLGIVKCEV
ncbi:MAG: class I tRNA ligase family protein [Anaerolineae bacterium]|nr:class I tRNA ligase family protein [Anaerolineae bacterium]